MPMHTHTGSVDKTCDVPKNNVWRPYHEIKLVHRPISWDPLLWRNIRRQAGFILKVGIKLPLVATNQNWKMNYLSCCKYSREKQQHMYFHNKHCLWVILSAFYLIFYIYTWITFNWGNSFWDEPGSLFHGKQRQVSCYLVFNFGH